MAYVRNITGPKGLMCWCAEGPIKWQCSEPAGCNENIVFWINWNEAVYPAASVHRDLYHPTRTVLPWQWLLEPADRLYSSVYLPAFAPATLLFPQRPASPTLSHTHSHLCKPRFPHKLFTERFSTTSQVLIALLWVTSTSSECAGFFVFFALFPALGFEETAFQCGKCSQLPEMQSVMEESF